MPRPMDLFDTTSDAIPSRPVFRLRARGPLRARCALSTGLVMFLLAGVPTPALPRQVARDPVPVENPRDWQADLDTMLAEMRARHDNLFHTVEAARFDSAADALRTRIPELDRPGILVEIARLAALVGDGHTRFWLNRPSDTGFGQVALRVYRFADGWHVRAVDDRHAWAAGRRLLAVGGVDIDEAFARIAPLVSRDNEQTVLAVGADYLVIPEVLHAVGLSGSSDSVTYRIADPGSPDGRSLTLPRIPAAALGGVDVSSGIPGNPVDVALVGEGVTLRTAAGPATPPLWLRAPAERLYAQHLPERNALYVRVSRVGDTEEATLAGFLEATYDRALDLGVDRYVLDLRRSGGGNNQLALPAILALVRRPDLDRRGRVWVIIGRHSFSATMTVANLLQRMTNVIFVGEPTGGRPNYFADARPARLPAAGVATGVSSLYWQDSEPWDDRPWIAPVVPVGLTAADYAAGRDPVLEAALTAPVPDPGGD